MPIFHVVTGPLPNKHVSTLSLNSRRIFEQMVNVLSKFGLKVRCAGLSGTVDCLKRGCVLLITRLVFLNPAGTIAACPAVPHCTTISALSTHHKQWYHNKSIAACVCWQLCAGLLCQSVFIPTFLNLFSVHLNLFNKIRTKFTIWKNKQKKQKNNLGAKSSINIYGEKTKQTKKSTFWNREDLLVRLSIAGFLRAFISCTHSF